MTYLEQINDLLRRAYDIAFMCHREELAAEIDKAATMAEILLSEQKKIQVSEKRDIEVIDSLLRQAFELAVLNNYDDLTLEIEDAGVLAEKLVEQEKEE